MNRSIQRLQSFVLGRFWSKSISLLVTFFFLITLLVGCAPPMKFEEGTLPDVKELEHHLVAGKSTTEDVMLALGPPRGKGKALLPIDPKPLTTWSYYYIGGILSSQKKDIYPLYLFVFFDQDRYAGYLWFSSVPESFAYKEN